VGLHQDLEADVVVVGAGASGLPAAIGAARAGARVILVEEDPVVGGAPSDYYVCLLYGGPITGILKEAEDLLKSKHSPTPRAQFFLPSAFQRAWAELLEAERNVNLLTGARAVGAVMSDGKQKPRVAGIEVEVSPAQSFRIRSKVTVDASGSGALSVLAGCRALYGREAKSEFNEPSAPEKADDRVQAVTWMYFVQRRPEAKALPRGFRPGVSVLIGIPPRGHEGPWPKEEVEKAPDPGLYLQWGCAVECRDTRDPIELGRAQQQAYKAMERDHTVLQEHGYMVYLAPRIGVREGNRIPGEHIITENDIRGGAFPPDTVAVADYGLDIWRPKREDTRDFGGHDEDGTVEVHGLETARYGIPYRALVARDVDGLLVVGKCMSGTHIAQSSFRVQPIVASAGQAAGVAAALAAKQGIEPRAVNPDEVRAVLHTPPQHVRLSFEG